MERRWEIPAFGQKGKIAYGRPLVEVFSVELRLNNPVGKLYGTITVTDGIRRQYIYNRKSQKSQKKRKRDEGDSDSGSALLLNGPRRVISALGNFVIDVDLMDDIRGGFEWNVYDFFNVYDSPLQEDVDGDTGSAIVNYAVFSDAVRATVEVLLLNGYGNDPAYVYGQITARNTNFTNESTLFLKTLDEHRRVSPGEHIPLSRSVVAVPWSSSLIVGANLFVHNGYERQSEREIAVGAAEFPPQRDGTFQRDIQGNYGMIQVKVTWTSNIYDPCAPN